MNEFKEKWDNEPRFKTKIKLLLYTLFVIFVAIFAISNREITPAEEQEKQYDNNIENNENINNIIEIPSEYNYTIDITINDNNYKYIGIKTLQRENITKQTEENITNYIYENNNYYEEDGENYILSTKEDIYDIVDYNYLDLEKINEYLSKSTKIGNQHYIYLKDMILGTDSEEYIVITINQNYISIDYTSLMKNFDKKVEKYLIDIEIEDKE